MRIWQVREDGVTPRIHGLKSEAEKDIRDRHANARGVKPIDDALPEGHRYVLIEHEVVEQGPKAMLLAGLLDEGWSKQATVLGVWRVGHKDVSKVRVQVMVARIE